MQISFSNRSLRNYHAFHTFVKNALAISEAARCKPDLPRVKINLCLYTYVHGGVFFAGVRVSRVQYRVTQNQTTVTTKAHTTRNGTCPVITTITHGWNVINFNVTNDRSGTGHAGSVIDESSTGLPSSPSPFLFLSLSPCLFLSPLSLRSFPFA